MDGLDSDSGGGGGKKNRNIDGVGELKMKKNRVLREGRVSGVDDNRLRWNWSLDVSNIVPEICNL